MNLVHCPNCDFITTEVEIPELSLNNLYFDYRTATYNQDRSKYEPGYLDISSKIGDAEEINYRVQSLNRYLDQFEDTVFDPTRVRSALDYGGAEGQFLPRLGTQTKKYVLEVSDAIPLLHVKKMNQLESGVEFDFIQLAHVLEHISNPRNFLEGIIPHLENKGYLYIEVPMEIRECKKLEDGEVEKYHMIIHEHINQFSENSIRLMLGSLKLNVLDCSIEDYRLPWANLSIIRALAQKD